jgi:transketolase
LINYEKLNDKANEIRKCIKKMILNSGGGHAGGSMSIAEVLAALYFSILKHDPQNPNLPDRDRLILSKGHAGLGLYSALNLAGYFPKSYLETYALNGPLMMHPDAHEIPGIEFSTGSLGHGLSIAVGIALAGKLKKSDYFTFCILGDGECHEGMVWEAAMAASHYKLQRLIAIIDRNNVGNDGAIDKVINLEPLETKWSAFGWETRSINGNDIHEVAETLYKCKTQAKGPYAIISNTLKGKGLIPSIAGTGKSHYINGNEQDVLDLFLI